MAIDDKCYRKSWHRKVFFLTFIVFVGCLIGTGVNDWQFNIVSYSLQMAMVRCQNLPSICKSMFPRKRSTANQEARERNARLIKRLLLEFYPTLLVLWLHCLLVGCGDIHPNPGPSSSSNSSSVSSLSNVSLPP